MSRSVESAIRDQLRSNDTAQDPIDLDEVIARAATDVMVAVPPAEPARSRTWLLATAACVAVLAGGIGVFVMWPEDNQPKVTTVDTTTPPTTTPPTTTSTPTATTAPPPPTTTTTLPPADLSGTITVDWVPAAHPDGMTIDWLERVGFGEWVDGEWMVIDGGGEWRHPDCRPEGMAHGCGDVDGERRTRLWRSTDGVEWTVEALEGLDDVYVIHTAFMGDQYFIRVIENHVTVESDLVTYEETGWATYRSTNLVDWERLGDVFAPTDPLGGDVLGGDDFLLWRWTDDIILQGASRIRTVSRRDLSPMASTVDPFGPDLRIFDFLSPSQTSTADRFYAAVGGASDGRGPWQVWSSPDGIDWRLDLTLEERGSAGEPPLLAATRDGIMVYEGGFRGSLYHADSGGEFRKIPKPGLDSAIWIAADDDVFVVWRDSSNDVYLTRDGQTWTELSLDTSYERVWPLSYGLAVGPGKAEYRCASDDGDRQCVPDGEWQIGTIGN